MILLSPKSFPFFLGLFTRTWAHARIWYLSSWYSQGFGIWPQYCLTRAEEHRLLSQPLNLLWVLLHRVMYVGNKLESKTFCFVVFWYSVFWNIHVQMQQYCNGFKGLSFSCNQWVIQALGCFTVLHIMLNLTARRETIYPIFENLFFSHSFQDLRNIVRITWLVRSTGRF